MSLADVVDLLACPACAERDRPDAALTLDGTTLRCAERHAYDVARQGHVNLLGHAVPANADGPEMVAARERFLATGAYERLADALARAVVRATTGAPAVLDVGAGPGWYLDRVLAATADAGRAGRGLALDVSPAAARRAARSTRPVGAVVADAWGRLPVRTGAVDVVLSVFAPRRPEELARVLAPGGTVLVAHPLPEHLAALRQAWGLLDVEPGKQERLAASFAGHLVPDGHEPVDVRYAAAVDRAAVEDLVGMGPNAFHRGTVDAEDDRDREVPGTVDVAVRVSGWRASD